MTRWRRVAGLFAVIGGLLVACEKRVPQTGRTVETPIGRQLAREVGAVAYRRLVDGRTVEQGESAELLETVVARLLPRRGSAPHGVLIRVDSGDDVWCLPGERLGVESGALPVLRSESGLASVVAHVLGHCHGQHGEERLGQRLRSVGGLDGLARFASGARDAAVEPLLLTSLGAAQSGETMPFGRAHEVEADVMALLALARAGYPPEELLAVWSRLAPDGTLQAVHPWSTSREGALRDWLPRANKRYRRNALPASVASVRWGAP